MARMIGRTLLHYEIESKLGEGGMGAVYKARDTRLGRDVALKFLPRQLAAGSVFRARFEVEARAAAALNHPNVAAIHAIEECDGEPFLVLEYVAGSSLRERIAQGPVPLDQALHFTRQIASGLQAAHDRGIVHRDIKSSNLMVTPDGTVKILDFGLARIGAGTDLTETRATLGTISAMSPEQVRGEPADARSDIWSLGVVLYEMLAGHAPFRGEHDQAVLYAIANTEPPPPSSLRNGIPAAVERLVHKAMARAREARYARVADLLADLESLDDASPSAKPARPPALAVLPFTNVRNDPSTDFLGFALADQVIGSLSDVTELLVRPSISVRKYQGQTIDARAVGQDLNVEFLLTGFFLKQDDDIRLNVEMVDIRSDEMVWRDSIRVRYENAFELQDVVAEKVLRGLSMRLSNNERTRRRADVPADPLAYEKYLRAVSCPLTTEGSRLAATMAEQAIALDPKYAPAWVEFGFRLALWNMEALLGREAFARAEAAYRQALSLNPDMAPALKELALHCTNTARPEEAAQFIERLFQRTPDSAEAHYVLGYLYRYTGMLDEAVREVDRTLELDPGNRRYRGAGWAYISHGDYQKAYDAFTLDPDGTVGIAWRGMSLYLMGNRDRAIEHFDRAAAIEPDTFVGIRHAGISACLKGDLEMGHGLLRRLEERIPKDHDPEHWYLLAGAYGLMGDDAGTIRALERAVDGGYFSGPGFLRDPLLEGVRGDAGFERVLALARQKHEAFKSRAFPALERAVAAGRRT